jgi:hypothetical protein
MIVLVLVVVGIWGAASHQLQDCSVFVQSQRVECRAPHAGPAGPDPELVRAHSPASSVTRFGVRFTTTPDGLVIEPAPVARP